MRNRLSLATTAQHGAALLMILIAVVALAALLISALKSNPQIERDKVTADVLSQAKDALIGYAATYRDDGHANDVFGYLPLPDLGSSRNGTPEEGNAAGSFTGNTKNLTVIGRLPWRALKLPALRDSSGECLWYAVSGSFQNALPANVLNWDSLGHFDAYTSDGTSGGTVSSTGSNFAQRPVAIVFSAGTVLPGQNRQTSTTDTVTTCGGNYDARNYLDPHSADANLNNILNYFTGTTNNATGYAYNLTGSADGSQLDAAALAAPKAVIFGDVSTALSGLIANDKAIVITAEDIFKRIKQRSDFKSDIDTMVDDLAACLNAIPVASLPIPNGSKGIGSNLETSCPPLAIGTQKGNVYANWKENLLYAKLPVATTVTIDGSPSPSPCAAVLLFGGERISAQTRATTTYKNDATMYLEGVNAASFPGGTTYSGILTYNKTTPTADMLRCITGTGGGSWPFEYPTQWPGVPALDPATVAVGGGTDTTGTSGNDDVNITGNLVSWVDLKSGNDELLVTGNFTGGGNFGAGDDTVKIGGNSTGYIALGSGDDYLDIGGNSSGYIDAGDDNDKIRIGGDAIAGITLGSGNDELHILGSASGSIATGSGDDKVRIEGDLDAYIDLGGDDDYLVVFGNSQGIQAGDGDDIVLIGGNATGWLDLGTGNNYLEILGNSAGLASGGGNDTIKISGDATNSINLGDGNDNLKILGNSAYVNASGGSDVVEITGDATGSIDLGSGNDYLRVGGTITWIDGGSGTDRIYLPHYTTADCATLLNSKISTNVEHVKVSNGMCRGTDFTFP